MTDTIDTAEVAETTGEIVPYESTPAGLFGADGPTAAITRATEVADVLARVIEDQRLYNVINGKKVVSVEGWTLLASSLGLFPYTAWTHRLEDGWEARVELRTNRGVALAAAEVECLRAERSWARSSDHSIRAMSQTRATRNTCRQVLGFVMQLAGFDPTPPDEMPAEPERRAEPQPTEPVVPKPSREQMQRIGELIVSLAEAHPGIDWKAKAREIAGCPGDKMTPGVANIVIDQLEELQAELQQAA